MHLAKSDQHSETSRGKERWRLMANRTLIRNLAVTIGTLLCFALFFVRPSFAQDTANPIDPAADEVIRSMSDFLAKQGSFSFEAEILYDLVWGGDDGDWDIAAEKLTFVRNGRAVVRRPDRFVVALEQDDQRVQYHYDGKTITISDSAAKAFVRKQAPASIDETIKLLREAYNSDPPLSDLLEANLYDSHMAGVDAASYVGKANLRGTDVHHIAFASKGMDWQVWIAAGDEPVPVLLQILQRDENFWPSYQAWFTNWEFNQDVPDSVFSFDIPDDSIETQFVEDEKWDLEAAQ